ncbi:MAG: DUF4837 family protein [Bacteroidota bacterium]
MANRILFTAIIFLSLISCTNKEKMTMVGSTGRINHLLIVMNNNEWQGEIGDALRNIIAEPLEGLPQEEAQFSVNQVTPKAFTTLFKPTRNILFVGFDEKKNFYSNKDVYASPQVTLTILGKDKEELIRNINDHKEEIINTFKTRDLALYQQKITAKTWKNKNLETFNNSGFSLKIPMTYSKVEDDGDFLWFRYRFTKGQLNILTYTVPLDSDVDFNVENIIKIRDSIGKKHIPGQFENTHMITEPQYEPATKMITLDGKDAIETRGLWIVKNDYMGGPFVNYAIHDEANDRMIILEGFSYSPATNKRDFVFEMEAILKTFRMN